LDTVKADAPSWTYDTDRAERGDVLLEQWQGYFKVKHGLDSFLVQHDPSSRRQGLSVDHKRGGIRLSGVGMGLGMGQLQPPHPQPGEQSQSQRTATPLQQQPQQQAAPAAPREKKEQTVLKKASRIEGMEKYYKMLKMGLPEGAVKLSMTKDGVASDKAAAFWGEGESEGDGGGDDAGSSGGGPLRVKAGKEPVFSPLGKPGGKMKALQWTKFNKEDAATSALWTEVKEMALSVPKEETAGLDTLFAERNFMAKRVVAVGDDGWGAADREENVGAIPESPVRAVVVPKKTLFPPQVEL
jgi:hypothetical protein